MDGTLSTNLLLEYKADPCVTIDDRTDTDYPIERAHDGNFSKIIKLLLHASHGSLIKFGDFFPLHYAVENADIELIKVILNRIEPMQLSDIDRQNYFNKTPLHLAEEIDNDEIINLLINKGAKITIRDAEEKTVIDYATEKFKQKRVALYTDTLNKRKLKMLDYIPPAKRWTTLTPPCSNFFPSLKEFCLYYLKFVNRDIVIDRLPKELQTEIREKKEIICEHFEDLKNFQQNNSNLMTPHQAQNSFVNLLTHMRKMKMRYASKAPQFNFMNNNNNYSQNNSNVQSSEPKENKSGNSNEPPQAKM